MVTRDSLADAATRAAALLGDDPQRALVAADAMLLHAPRDPRALLIRASALRRLGDVAAAHAVLAPLATAYPNAARTQYELGLALLALSRPDSGVAALRRAVAIDPDLGEARQALGDHLFQTGDTAQANCEFAEQERRAVRDPALRPAADALFAGDLVQAETLLRAQLARRPDDGEALRLMGEVRLRQSDFSAAQVLFARCVALDPTNAGARFSYALTLFKRQLGAAALAQMTPLLGREPANPAYRNLQAAILALVGRHDEALVVYESLLAQLTHHPAMWLNYGHALRTIGRQADAVAAYRRAIAIAPQLGEAYWSLANLKTETLTAAEIAAMAAQLQRADMTDDDRLHLHYASGKAWEDAGDHARSFAHYAAGGQLRLTQQPYDAAAATALAQRIAAVCTPALFARHAGSGNPSRAPIFVLGLPRSGSTLVEQILASHSAVEGTAELPDIPVLVQDLGDFPAALAALTPADCARAGAEYLRRTLVHRTAGVAHFIDKMPVNFSHIGFIQLILPNARIIDVRRQPMAAGFSCFKQLFAAGHGWSADLATAGRYYRDYVELMRHFDAVLPGRIHRIIYEDLIDDTELAVRRMLDYCALPFEPGCLQFHANPRAVRTVSSEQVRRPIFRDGVDQWRHYEPWLDPLRTALGPVLDDWRGHDPGVYRQAQP